MRIYQAEVAMLRCRMNLAQAQGFAPLAMAEILLAATASVVRAKSKWYLQDARRLIWQYHYFDLREEWEAFATIIHDRVSLLVLSTKP